MAHAQKLTDQVKVLTTRVQELEAALAETSDGKQSHPLLQIRLPIDGEEQVEVEDIPGISGAIGSLSLGLDGQTIYHGECSSSTVSFLLYRTSFNIERPPRGVASTKFIAGKFPCFRPFAELDSVSTDNTASNQLPTPPRS